jgi:hypothetical protein
LYISDKNGAAVMGLIGPQKIKHRIYDTTIPLLMYPQTTANRNSNKNL